MNDQQFDELIDNLNAIRSDLQHFLDTQDSHAFTNKTRELAEKLCASSLTFDQEEKIFELFKPYKSELQTHYTESICQQEVRHASELIQKKETDADVLKHYLSEAVNNEINFFNLNKEHTVLDIGIGPLPITSCAYARQTGCRVHGHDIVEEYTKFSKQIISLFGLSDKVFVHNKDGLSFAGGDFDIALIAMYSYPKTPMLELLLEKLPAHAKITVRSAAGLLQLFVPDNADPALIAKYPDRVYESKITLQSDING